MMQGAGSQTWVGASYVASASSWRSMAGSTFAMGLPWASSQPANNAAGYCAAIQTANWQWESDSCTKTFPSLCMFCTSILDYAHFR